MKKLPTLQFETEALEHGYELIIGVDEVGRGALAGPVVAGACAIFSSKFLIYNQFSNLKVQSANSQPIDWLGLGIDDSKRLTAGKRQELARIIKKNAVWGIGESSAATINRLGIVKATEKAMRQAIKSLRLKSKSKKSYLLIDAFYVKHVKAVGLRNQKAIVKGDQKSVSIAAASIIAKVHRDRLMASLSRTKSKSKAKDGSKYKFRFKKYGWEKNKGYGTEKHLEAIKKYGVTKLHRKDFVG